MFCSKCGKEIPDGSIFCQFCGEKITQEDVPIEPQKENNEQIIESHKYHKDNKIVSLLNDNPHYVMIGVLLIGIVCMVFSHIKATNLYKDALNEYEQKNYYLAQEKIKQLAVSNSESEILRKKIEFAIALKEGNEHFSNKKYKEALESYQKAQAINSSPEITKKIESIKTIKQSQINSLKAYMRTNYDNVENITWIKDKTSPIYVNSNGFYLYMGKDKDNYVWLRLKVSYYGNDWIFWKTMIFNIDGQKTSFTLPYGEVKHDNDTMVWEVADLPYDNYADLINKVINSKITILRLQGDDHHYDKTITQTEKQALKRVLDYYEATKQ